MSTEWTPICSQQDLIPHSGVCALHGEQQVALFYLPEQEQVFAIANYDPFSGAHVIARGIIGDLQGRLVVAAPLYKQHFALQDGRCLEDESVRLPVWPARLSNGTVWLAA